MGRDYFMCIHNSSMRCANYGSEAYRKQQKEEWRLESERFFAAIDAGKPAAALRIPRCANPCTIACKMHGDCRYCVSKGYTCQFCNRNQMKMNFENNR